MTTTRTQQREQGFSLIELLVVVVILGVLAAVAIPVFNNQRSKAALASAQSDARALGEQVKMAILAENSRLTGSGGDAPTIYAQDPTTVIVNFGLGYSTSVPVKLSDGSALAEGNLLDGNGDNIGGTSSLVPNDTSGAFCLAIVGNYEQVAVINENGLVANATGCASGVATF